MTKSPLLDQPPEVVWRYERLLKLGFNRVQAEDLYAHPDVEHEARELLDADCPPAVAYRILRD